MENGILEAGGTYGDPDVGEPIEYDHVIIDHDAGRVDIEFYNKGITLALGDDEEEIAALTLRHRTK